jgi:putative sterol carrier protein
MSAPFVYPSEDWAKAFCKEINNTAEYRESAKGWQWDLVLIATKIPPQVAQAVGTSAGAIKLILREGQCLGVEFYTDPSKADAPFIIEGEYSVWRQIMDGKLDPTSALLSNKLKVKKGSMTTLIRYAKAAVALTKATSKVPTKFLD